MIDLICTVKSESQISSRGRLVGKLVQHLATTPYNSTTTTSTIRVVVVGGGVKILSFFFFTDEMGANQAPLHFP